MWRARFAPPARTASTFGTWRLPLATPACIFNARTVHTSTTASGRRPVCRHLMSRNFCAPRSAPNPASVTTMSHSANAAFVATTELQPWAMLANGPPWTKAGLPSRLCTRFGCKASQSNAVSAPSAPKSPAVTGAPPCERATTMRAKRFSRSARSLAKQNTAMVSDAAVMSNPAWRRTPRPESTLNWRSARSFTSSERRHVTASGSMSKRLPQ